MNLIAIHGAPAVGKLTVANGLAKLTGSKVFHNHLSIDCIKPVFDFGSPAFWRLIMEIRAETLAEAAREGIDVIHTFCYEKGSDDAQFWRLIQAVETNGGEVKIVLLVCGDEERRRFARSYRQIDRSGIRWSSGQESGSAVPARRTEDVGDRYDEYTTGCIRQAHRNVLRAALTLQM